MEHPTEPDLPPLHENEFARELDAILPERGRMLEVERTLMQHLEVHAALDPRVEEVLLLLETKLNALEDRITDLERRESGRKGWFRNG